MKGRNKQEELVKILKSDDAKYKIIFCNNIGSCRSTDHYLQENGIVTSCYHGQIPPKTRLENYKKFMSGETSVLVCTDIAARGLDTAMVDHVILFDFPMTSTEYLHRVGRTARAGNEGKVTSLIDKHEYTLAKAIITAYKNGEPLDNYTRSNARIKTLHINKLPKEEKKAKRKLNAYKKSTHLNLSTSISKAYIKEK